MVACHNREVGIGTMHNTLRGHDATHKAKVVLEAVIGEKTLTQL